MLSNRGITVLAWIFSFLQEFAHLPITGKLDILTRKKMAEPRCGMADTVEMLSENGEPAFKWKKNALTYAFVNFTPDLPRQTVRWKRGGGRTWAPKFGKNLKRGDQKGLCPVGLRQSADLQGSDQRRWGGHQNQIRTWNAR